MQAGHNLATALAGSGQPWANLQLITLAAWVRRQVVPQLQAAGWKQLLPDYDLPFVQNLLKNHLAAGNDNYFAGRAKPEDLAPAFLRAFHELRHAGLSPEDLGNTERDARKMASLAPLYRAYLDGLAERMLYDDATIFAYALAHPAPAPAPGKVLYAILDEVSLSTLAYRYLKALAGDQLLRIGRADYGLEAPAWSAAGCCATAPVFPVEMPVQVGIGGQGFSRRLTPQDAGDLRLVQALGAEGEVRMVLREILQQALPLDSIEIAYTTDAPYLSLLYDAAERSGILVTFADGLPADQTRPGQALAGLLRWVASDYDPRELESLCRAGLIHFAKHQGEVAGIPEAHEVATLLRQARIRKGRASYQAGFSRLERELRDQLEYYQTAHRPSRHLEVQLAHLQAVWALVEGLFNLLPTGESLLLRQVTEAGQQFLHTYAPVRAGYDDKAIVALTVHLEDIGSSVQMADTLPRLAEYLADLVARHRVDSLGARPGHLHLAPLERAGYTHRQHLYVLGLDEGSFPGRGIENPILLDEERARLSSRLALSPGLARYRARPGERVWHLVRVLGMAPGSVTLLAKCRDLADGSEFYPSAFFQHLAEQLHPKEPLPITPQLPPADQLALDDLEALLAGRFSAGFPQLVTGAFPWLVAGQEAVYQRAGTALSSFHGWLGQETPELGPANGQTIFSASRLESLVKCPYQYFLKCVLHIEPPEEEVEEGVYWLHPLEMGKLLHELLCGFMVGLREKGERPDQRLHEKVLKQQLAQKVKAYRQAIPVVYEAAFRADVQRLEQTAEIFLQAESRRTAAEPVDFEVSFGFGRDTGLHQPGPVALRLWDGGQLLLRGYIDRVDRKGEDYALWDYKSGSATRYTEEVLQSGGTFLQWALYAQVVDEILHQKGLPGKVAESGYFFVSDRGYGARVAPQLPSREKLGALLRPVLELAAAGCFFHLQKQEHCEYCPYNSICGGERLTRDQVPEIREALAGQPRIGAMIGAWLDD